MLIYVCPSTRDADAANRFLLPAQVVRWKRQQTAGVNQDRLYRWTSVADCRIFGAMFSSMELGSLTAYSWYTLAIRASKINC